MGEEGGTTLVGLALTGFVLLAGVAAVDVGALAGARAAAQTAADMAALAALIPQDGSAALAPRRRVQVQGSGASASQRRAIAQGSAAAQAEGWREQGAAEIAAANGAELVAATARRCGRWSAFGAGSGSFPAD